MFSVSWEFPFRLNANTMNGQNNLNWSLYIYIAQPVPTYIFFYFFLSRPIYSNWPYTHLTCARTTTGTRSICCCCLLTFSPMKIEAWFIPSAYCLTLAARCWGVRYTSVRIVPTANASFKCENRLQAEKNMKMPTLSIITEAPSIAMWQHQKRQRNKEKKTTNNYMQI